MKKVSYYVVYKYPLGTGYVGIDVADIPVTYDVILSWVEKIKEENKIDNVIIINWIKLDKVKP